MKEILITSGTNGYPQNLRAGWVDFENFAEAEAFAQKIGGAVVHLRQRDGWRYFEERGRAWDPYALEASDFSDSADLVTPAEAGAYVEELRQLARDNAEYYEQTPEELAEELRKLDQLAEKLAQLADGEALIVEDGMAGGVVQVVAMSYRCDVWVNYIGVVSR